MTVISFVGHRPDNPFMGGYDFHSKKNNLIKKKIAKKFVEVANAIEDDEITCIFGGSLGTDQLAFRAVQFVRDTKKTNKKIYLKIAVPYKKQPDSWMNDTVKQIYFKQLSEADEVVYVDTMEEYISINAKIGEYSFDKIQARNMYLAKECEYLIAVWDGDSGEVETCIKCAKKMNRMVIIMDPREFGK